MRKSFNVTLLWLVPSMFIHVFIDGFPFFEKEIDFWTARAVLDGVLAFSIPLLDSRFYHED